MRTTRPSQSVTMLSISPYLTTLSQTLQTYDGRDPESAYTNAFLRQDSFATSHTATYSQSMNSISSPQLQRRQEGNNHFQLSVNDSNGMSNAGCYARQNRNLFARCTSFRGSWRQLVQHSRLVRIISSTFLRPDLSHCPRFADESSNCLL